MIKDPIYEEKIENKESEIFMGVLTFMVRRENWEALLYY